MAEGGSDLTSPLEIDVREYDYLSTLTWPNLPILIKSRRFETEPAPLPSTSTSSFTSGSLQGYPVSAETMSSNQNRLNSAREVGAGDDLAFHSTLNWPNVPRRRFAQNEPLHPPNRNQRNWTAGRLSQDMAESRSQHTSVPEVDVGNDTVFHASFNRPRVSRSAQNESDSYPSTTSSSYDSSSPADAGTNSNSGSLNSQNLPGPATLHANVLAPEVFIALARPSGSRPNYSTALPRRFTDCQGRTVLPEGTFLAAVKRRPSGQEASKLTGPDLLKIDGESYNAFARDQLVPLSYLAQPKWADLRPMNFWIRTPDRLTILAEPIQFQIIPKGIKYLFGSALFTVTVRSPAGLLPVHVQTEDVLNCHACSFQAREYGDLLISVKLGVHGEHHIEGSPFSLQVSRVYDKDPRSIVTLVTLPVETLAHELQVSPNSKIWGITYEPISEDIFAADRDGGQILRFSTLIPPGKMILTGKFPTRPLGFLASFCPTGIVNDPTHQRLIVTDTDNDRVWFFSYFGQVLGSFGRHGNGDGELWFPSGVAVSPAGDHIVVADTKNYRVQLFTDGGDFLRACTVFGASLLVNKKEFGNPCGISFDNSGQLIYVSYFNIQNVFSVSLDFTAKGTLCLPLRCQSPQGLAMDGAGTILICDSDGNQVRAVGTDGTLVESMEAVGGEPFKNPVSICLCGNGRVCVVDLDGTRIRIF